MSRKKMPVETTATDLTALQRLLCGKYLQSGMIGVNIDSPHLPLGSVLICPHSHCQWRGLDMPLSLFIVEEVGSEEESTVATTVGSAKDERMKIAKSPQLGDTQVAISNLFKSKIPNGRSLTPTADTTAEESVEKIDLKPNSPVVSLSVESQLPEVELPVRSVEICQQSAAVTEGREVQNVVETHFVPSKSVASDEEVLHTDLASNQLEQSQTETDLNINTDESRDETFNRSAESDSHEMQRRTGVSAKNGQKELRRSEILKSSVWAKRTPMKTLPARPSVKQFAKRPTSDANSSATSSLASERIKAKRRRIDSTEDRLVIAQAVQLSTVTKKNAKLVGLVAKKSENVGVNREKSKGNGKQPDGRKQQQKNSHNVQAERKFECAQCHESFATKQGLKRHLFVHSSERQFVCKEKIGGKACRKAFKQEGNLTQHQKLKHSPGESKYRCDECGKTFAGPSGLRQHLIYGHVNTQFPCKKCRKIFNRPETLKLHMKRSHPTKAEKAVSWKCFYPGCGSSFPREAELLQHSRVHSNVHSDVVYPCDKCDTTFAYPHSLKAHQKKKHSAQPFTKFQCGQCEEIFFNPVDLSQHRLREHSDKPTYPCGNCPLIFLKPSILRVHCSKRKHQPK